MKKVRTKDGHRVPDPRIDRPKTVREAREQIRQTFVDNDWDEDAQSRYFEIAGLKPKALDKLTSDEIRTVIDRMERSKMILYKQE